MNPTYRKLVKLANRLGMGVEYSDLAQYYQDAKAWKRTVEHYFELKDLVAVGEAPGKVQLAENSKGKQYLIVHEALDEEVILDFLHEIAHAVVGKFTEHDVYMDEIEVGIIAIERIICEAFSPTILKGIVFLHNDLYSWPGKSYTSFGTGPKDQSTYWHWLRSDKHAEHIAFFKPKLARYLKDL